MKYKIHYKEPIVEGTPYGSLVGEKFHEGIVFDTTDQAADALKLGAQYGLLAKPLDQYVIVAYTDQGIMTEPVSEEVFTQAQKDAETVKKTSRTVLHAMGAVVAARQVYAAAVNAVQTDTYPQAFSNPKMIADILLREADQAGQQPFNVLDTVEALAEQVIPWLKSNIDAGLRESQRTQIQAAREFNEARLKTSIPLGYPLYYPENCELLRGKHLVLVGHEAPLRYVVDRIIEHVKLQSWTVLDKPPVPFGVLHLCAEAEPPAVPGPVLNIGRNRWGGTFGGNGDRAKAVFVKFMQACVLPRLQHPIDLLVVDDLALAWNDITHVAPIGGCAPWRCDKAAKYVMQWATHHGIAVVSCVPGVPDFSLTRFAELKEHAAVCYVRKVESPETGKVRIFVGDELNDDLAHFDVLQEQLALPNKLLLP